MGDLEQSQLDSSEDIAVRDYLSARLDPQLGRAEAHFREFLAEEKTAPVIRRPVFALPHLFRGWTLSLAGAALAATLAALWTGPSLKPLTTPPGSVAKPGSIIPTTPVNNMLIEQDVQSQTYDDGTYMNDNGMPVRVFRRRDLQRTRWYDKNDDLQGEQVEPQDHVVYVPVKTY